MLVRGRGTVSVRHASTGYLIGKAGEDAEAQVKQIWRRMSFELQKSKVELKVNLANNGS